MTNKWHSFMGARSFFRTLSSFVARSSSVSTFCASRETCCVPTNSFRYCVILAVTVITLLNINGSAVWPQTVEASVVIVPPKIESLDENYVNLFSGKLEMRVPALALGDVSFTPFSFNGPHFAKNAISDENYGKIIYCGDYTNQIYIGSTQCSGSGSGQTLQVILGQQRATFSRNASSGLYIPASLDGSLFSENSDGVHCTWTKKDGTKVIFNGYHDAQTSLCLGDTVSSIVYPDGRTLTYHYYGLGSISPASNTPIISIASNTGYLLKYIYTSTPAIGAESSVIAINRVFETCDPSSVSCNLTYAWPTATITWDDYQIAAPGDPYFAYSVSYNPRNHFILTIKDQNDKRHIFETDSYSRIISYRPPSATSAQYFYKHCTIANTTAAQGGYNLLYCPYPVWNSASSNDYLRSIPPIFFDDVQTVQKGGQTWSYAHAVGFGGDVRRVSTWTHYVSNPLGKSRFATGGSTPGLENVIGPISFITGYDGSSITFENSRPNPPKAIIRPLGGGLTYDYDTESINGRIPRYNLLRSTETPNTNSGTSDTIVVNAHYTSSCGNIYSCNKPDYVTDANGNRTDYVYDDAHGGMRSRTDPAVYSPATGGEVRPQRRYTFVQRSASYLNSSGAMTQDPSPIWLIATESYCRSGAAAGAGCALADDEVVTSYDYGPNSGPNNLMLRGQVVTAHGQAHRVCFGHDRMGNKIWEVSANANASSCPAF